MKCIKNYLNYKAGDTVEIIRFSVSSHIINGKDIIPSSKLLEYFEYV